MDSPSHIITHLGARRYHRVDMFGHALVWFDYPDHSPQGLRIQWRTHLSKHPVRLIRLWYRFVVLVPLKETFVKTAQLKEQALNWLLFPDIVFFFFLVLLLLQCSPVRRHQTAKVSPLLTSCEFKHSLYSPHCLEVCFNKRFSRVSCRLVWDVPLGRL